MVMLCYVKNCTCVYRIYISFKTQVQILDRSLTMMMMMLYVGKNFIFWYKKVCNCIPCLPVSSCYICENYTMTCVWISDKNCVRKYGVRSFFWGIFCLFLSEQVKNKKNGKSIEKLGESIKLSDVKIVEGHHFTWKKFVCWFLVHFHGKKESNYHVLLSVRLWKDWFQDVLIVKNEKKIFNDGRNVEICQI